MDILHVIDSIYFLHNSPHEHQLVITPRHVLTTARVSVNLSSFWLIDWLIAWAHAKIKLLSPRSVSEQQISDKTKSVSVSCCINTHSSHKLLMIRTIVVAKIRSDKSESVYILFLPVQVLQDVAGAARQPKYLLINLHHSRRNLVARNLKFVFWLSCSACYVL